MKGIDMDEGLWFIVISVVFEIVIWILPSEMRHWIWVGSKQFVGVYIEWKSTIERKLHSRWKFWTHDELEFGNFVIKIIIMKSFKNCLCLTIRKIRIKFEDKNVTKFFKKVKKKLDWNFSQGKWRFIMPAAGF